MAIEARHYSETRERLAQDPIVRAMAAGLPVSLLEDGSITHESGTPRFGFMQAANAEYRARGGQDGGHIGGVAEAVIAVLKSRVPRAGDDEAQLEVTL